MAEKENHIFLYRAQPTGDSVPPVLKITAAGVIPEKIGLKAAAQLFEHEALMLENALYGSLPGGTYDRLCALMLKRKASHFIIAHTAFERQAPKE